MRYRLPPAVVTDWPLVLDAVRFEPMRPTTDWSWYSTGNWVIAAAWPVSLAACCATGLFGKMPPSVVTLAMVLLADAIGVVTWPRTAAIGASTPLIVDWAAWAKLLTLLTAPCSVPSRPDSVESPTVLPRLMAVAMSPCMASSMFACAPTEPLVRSFTTTQLIEYGI